MILFGNQQNRSNLVTYGNGLLYNWYAVSKANFAPAGWHVPTQTEFNTLATYLGGASVAGGKMKSTRTSEPYFSSNVGADNSSGFTAFGSGIRTESGTFTYLNLRAYYYTSIGNQVNLRNTVISISIGNSINSNNGLSIRLISDSSTWYPGMTITDLDGNKYATVKIGTQVWLKSNWKCTKYNDGTPIPNVTDGNGWSNLTNGAYCSYLNQPIIEYTEKFPL